MDTSIALICCFSNMIIYFILHQLVGVCYEYGTGVGKDEVEAVKYYKMAADQGNAIAQRNLGKTLTRVLHWYVPYLI